MAVLIECKVWMGWWDRMIFLDASWIELQGSLTYNALIILRIFFPVFVDL